MIEHSVELKDLAAALVKAQATVKGAVKDSSNPFYKSKYADLASVLDACGEALTANGLSVVQLPGYADDERGFLATLTTMLLHTSGQWVRETAGAPIAKPDAQGVGSAITYLRRYALQAVARVAPEDDDGNAASGAERSEGGFSSSAQRAVGSTGKTQTTGAGQGATGNPPISLTSLVTWGKYRGKTVKEVGPDYFEWLIGEARSQNKLDSSTAKFAAGALKALMPDLTSVPSQLAPDDEDLAFDLRQAQQEAAKAGAR